MHPSRNVAPGALERPLRQSEDAPAFDRLPLVWIGSIQFPANAYKRARVMLCRFQGIVNRVRGANLMFAMVV
jgi:hypothetical protein